MTTATSTAADLAAAKLAYRMGTHTPAQLRLIRAQFDTDRAAQRVEDEAAAHDEDRVITALRNRPATHEGAARTCTDCGKTIRVVSSPEQGTYCTCLDTVDADQLSE